MNDATRILAEMKARLDEHFKLSPVAPEHRPSPDTMRKFDESVFGDTNMIQNTKEAAADFAKLMREDDRFRALEERIARIEKALGLNV